MCLIIISSVLRFSNIVFTLKQIKLSLCFDSKKEETPPAAAAAAQGKRKII
jgi:hypothetical protein